jgi:mannose-6-phosphate isomerase
MALYSATKENVFLARATDIFKLFETVFFDVENGVLREFFNQDWSAGKNNGGPIEPGHMFEWVWLLRNYQVLSGVGVNHYADVLYAKAMEYGYCKDTGLICDSVDLKKPNKTPTFRTWPQTEFIKASIAQARAGKRGMLSNVSAAIDNMFNMYFDVPSDGGWVDCLDANGQPKDTLMPTSTFYHIISAAAETSDLAQNLRD